MEMDKIFNNTGNIVICNDAHGQYDVEFTQKHKDKHGNLTVLVPALNSTLVKKVDDEKLKQLYLQNVDQLNEAFWRYVAYETGMKNENTTIMVQVNFNCLTEDGERFNMDVIQYHNLVSVKKMSEGVEFLQIDITIDWNDSKNGKHDAKIRLFREHADGSRSDYDYIDNCKVNIDKNQFVVR